MEIDIQDSNKITVRGHLRDIGDFDAVKDVIENMVTTGAGSVEVFFADAFKLPSSAVGYLVKLSTVSRILVHVKVSDSRLHALFSTMGLTDILNISLHEDELAAEIG